MEVEKALTELGSYSKWQLERSTAMCVFCYMASAFHSFTIVFIGWSPPHHCKIPSTNNTNTSIWTTEVTDKCHLYSTVDDESIGCRYGYDYKSEGYTSIVTEFDLVCDRSHLPAICQTVYYGGMLFGSLLFPIVSDFFGRKSTAIVTMCLAGTAAICMVFAKSILPIIVTRFLVGSFIQGSLISQHMLNAELFPSKQRAFAAFYMQIYYTLWLMTCALIGYLLADWRHIAIAVGCASFLPLLCICLTKESVPWLVANGRGEEAVTILRAAAKRNGSEFSDGTLEDVLEAASRAKITEDQKVNEKQNGYFSLFRLRLKRIRLTVKEHLSCNRNKLGEGDVGIAEIMRHPKLRLWTIFLVFIWMNTNVVYFGLTLSSTTFVGNRFLNFFLSGVVEFPACFFMMFILQRFGRRFSVFLSYLGTAVFLVASNVVPEQVNGVDLIPLIMALNAIGKFFISTAFGALYVLTGEIYPTNVRSRGIGMASMFGKCGAMISPFCEVLARHSTVALGIVFGTTTVISSILVLPLPETKNQPMPETMHDIDMLAQKSKNCKLCFERSDTTIRNEMSPTEKHHQDSSDFAETPML